MEIVLIFIPESLTKRNLAGENLFGIFVPKNGRRCDAFYVLGASRVENVEESNVIGSCSPTSSHHRIRDNFIIVSYENNSLCLTKVYKDWKELSTGHCHVIQYDESSLIKSELFLPSEFLESGVTLDEGDHFKVLGYHIKKHFSSFNRRKKHLTVASSAVSTFEWISFICKVTKLSECSSVGLQMRETADSLKWLVVNSFEVGGLTLQTGNLLSAIVMDIFVGMLVPYLLEDLIMQRRTEFFNTTAFKIEELLEFIKYTIKWLMGSPAGLKLNYPLNYIMGNFFLFNIHLWWSFLGMIRPLLEIGCTALLKFGLLGVAFQIAILADIFSLVTFHLYCIYIYAARLFEFQLRGIISLSKIFLGRRKNPEPDKVDSCPYSTEQLFVGTVCFTVLLFLLPTTLVYYTVFTLIRLAFIFLGGALTRARFLLKILPIYSSVVWAVKPRLIMTTIQIIPVSEATSKAITLIAKPQASTWFETMKKCVPEILQPPKCVDWKGIISHVVTGKLM